MIKFYISGRTVGSTVHVVPLQSPLAHALYRLRSLPAPKYHRRVADYGQHANRCHLLRHVCWSRHHAHPIVRHLQTPLPRKSKQPLTCFDTLHRVTHKYVIVLCVCRADKAGGGVHDVEEVTTCLAAEDFRLLRASLPRQDVWWREHSGRTQRQSTRGKKHHPHPTSPHPFRTNLLCNPPLVANGWFNLVVFVI